MPPDHGEQSPASSLYQCQESEDRPTRAAPSMKPAVPHFSKCVAQSHARGDRSRGGGQLTTPAACSVRRGRSGHWQGSQTGCRSPSRTCASGSVVTQHAKFPKRVYCTVPLGQGQVGAQQCSSPPELGRRHRSPRATTQCTVRRPCRGGRTCAVAVRDARTRGAVPLQCL